MKIRQIGREIFDRNKAWALAAQRDRVQSFCRKESDRSVSFLLEASILELNIHVAR